MRLRSSGALAATVLLACAPAWSSPVAAGGESAAWTPKELTFVYQGFTTKYTCDGLRQRMRDVLIELGARREDLQVRSWGCTQTVAPDVFPGVTIRMSVLQPAASAGGEAVPAEWKTVDLVKHDPVEAAAECELIGQIRQKVLPLFTTRNVEFNAACEKKQLVLGGTRLTAEVLVPDTGTMPRSAAR